MSAQHEEGKFSYSFQTTLQLPSLLIWLNSTHQQDNSCAQPMSVTHIFFPTLPYWIIHIYYPSFLLSLRQPDAAFLTSEEAPVWFRVLNFLNVKMLLQPKQRNLVQPIAPLLQFVVGSHHCIPELVEWDLILKCLGRMRSTKWEEKLEMFMHLRQEKKKTNGNLI